MGWDSGGMGHSQFHHGTVTQHPGGHYVFLSSHNNFAIAVNTSHQKSILFCRWEGFLEESAATV